MQVQHVRGPWSAKRKKKAYTSEKKNCTVTLNISAELPNSNKSAETNTTQVFARIDWNSKRSARPWPIESFQ